MATYNFPNITPTSQTFELVTNTKMFQSPLSNAIQTVSRKGSYWKTSMVFNNLSGSQRAELQAFIAKMDGQTHVRSKCTMKCQEGVHTYALEKGHRDFRFSFK